MEFYQEDIIYREQERTKQEHKYSKNGEEVPIHLTLGEKATVGNEFTSGILPIQEMTKRNFYLQLFRTYCELPFQETMQSFVKVFNDVFVKEKP